MKKGFFLLLLISTANVVLAQHEQHTQKQEPQPQKKEVEVKQSKGNHIHGKSVEYDLFINDTTLGYVSNKFKVIAVNGGVPAPTLYFTEGDTAIIRVHNQLKKEETSIHWHGLLLPNEEDGVPYLTTASINAGATHTFKFPLIQNGTYWYHSHTSLQEQIGVYGSIVIYPRNYQKGNEKVLMLSDWIDERPMYVLKSLKRASDWYAIRKNAVQSWGEALVQGYLGDRFKTEWGRMPAMDVSDVYYDKFLINGRRDNDYPEVKPGEKVRLRIINGGASSYFWLQFSGGKMK
ncbi:MAG: copper oxidase, partial [Marivirga sp.]|nr:copper oxidase [Marivirga sp.]